MSKSKIEWTGETWNPLAGCTRASEGCDNCYAAAMSLRIEAMAEKDIADGKDPGRKAKYMGIANRNGKGVAAFNGKINLDYEALNEPLRWTRPRTVFVNSMSDLFHKDVPDGFIDQVFDVMAKTPQHTYQVLTKRPERMAEYVNTYWSMSLRPHIWLGTSVENQEQADKRIPALLRTRAKVRFLSMEPLLGSVMLQGGDYPSTYMYLRGNGGDERINWVIVGGESGPHARPLQTSWIASIRDQCRETGTPFFLKQLGIGQKAYGPGYLHEYEGLPFIVSTAKGNHMDEWPEALQVREMPKTN
jgi:protein gp37